MLVGILKIIPWSIGFLFSVSLLPASWLKFVCTETEKETFKQSVQN